MLTQKQRRVAAQAGEGPSFRLPVSLKPAFGPLRLLQRGDILLSDPEDGRKWIGRKAADNLDWPFALVYTDGEGFTETRKVDVDGIYETTARRPSIRYFTGFCHLRADRRTFRVDRVVAWAPWPQGAGASAAVVDLVKEPSIADWFAEQLLRAMD